MVFQSAKNIPCSHVRQLWNIDQHRPVIDDFIGENIVIFHGYAQVPEGKVTRKIINLKS